MHKKLSLLSIYWKARDVKPLITIIVPVRNEEKNIEKCLQSLKSLDYPNYEIIVVNDGSTDSTEHILKQFKTITVLIL